MQLSSVTAAVACACGVFFVVAPVSANYVPLPPLKVLDGGVTSTVKLAKALWGRFDVGGASIAVGELTGDAQSEIVIGEGLGKEPRVRVLAGDGRQLSSFLVYDKGFTRGVTIAVGDVNNDHSREIVTGTGFGGGPHVRVWNRNGKELFAAGGFFAYDSAFRGGVNVTVADIDGDGADEIITAPGFGGAPQVKAFRPDGTLVAEFFAFDPQMTQGVSVAGGDFDGDGIEEIAVAREGIGESEVRIFRFSGAVAEQRISFSVASAEYALGLSLSAGDVDGDGKDEVIVSRNAGRMVRAYTAGGILLREFTPYSGGADAVRAAAGDVDGDGKSELIAAPFPRLMSAPFAFVTASATSSGKFIEVDLKRQQLFAWENGRLAYTFLISSGIKRFPSPTGDFAVIKKIPKMNYVWNYGPNSPYNYNLPNVPWNLNFKPRFYIHDAYWHNNFGIPMSHGCINVNLPNSKWIYDWADAGTPVHVG